MPFRPRQRFGRFRRRFKRRTGFGNYGPPMRRTRWTRRKRVNQNLTREVRWFKTVVNVQNLAGTSGFVRLTVAQDNATTGVENTAQFTKFGSIWEEYKCLKMIMKLYPAHVGSESIVDDQAGVWAPRFIRGNIVTWVDPQGDSSLVTNILDVMGKPSSKIHNPRHFVKRWIDRPRSGYPTWGKMDQAGSINTYDSWPGMMRLFGQGFTPTTQSGPALTTFYYAEILYKVLFRSRHDL